MKWLLRTRLKRPKKKKRPSRYALDTYSGGDDQQNSAMDRLLFTAFGRSQKTTGSGFHFESHVRIRKLELFCVSLKEISYFLWLEGITGCKPGLKFVRVAETQS